MPPPPAAQQLARLLDLERPLTFLDLETTGLDPARDRIIEVALLRVAPTGSVRWFNSLIQPGLPVPAEVAKLTGLTDADLQTAPRLDEVVSEVLAFVDGADLAGYNILRFDLPLLERELARCGVELPGPPDRAVLDPLLIFRMRERHSLERVALHYLNRPVAQTHRAVDDVALTLAVFVQQLTRYGYQGSAGEVEREARRPYLDSGCRFREGDGEIVVCFGKHRGASLAEISKKEPSYLSWMIRKMDAEAAGIVRGWVEASSRVSGQAPAPTPRPTGVVAT